MPNGVPTGSPKRKPDHMKTLFVSLAAFAVVIGERIHALLFAHMASNGLALGINTLQVYQALARESAAIFEENAPFTSHVNRAHEDDFKEQNGQFKKGATINITIPPTANVYTGNVFAGGGSAEDTVERVMPVTFNKATDQKHVTLNMTAFEKVMSVPDAKAEWVDRFLKPKIASLAASVEADMIARAVRLCPNWVGTPGTPITAMSVFGQARSKMQRSLTPKGERYALIDTSTNAGIVGADRGLFNPNAEISKQYREGYVGYAQGAEVFEIVNGSVVTNSGDVVGAVNLVPAQGASSIAVLGLTVAPVAGMTFTIAGVYDVHPLTGTAYGSAAGDLKQFTVLPGSTTTQLNFYPALQAVMPNKTVSALPVDTAAINFTGAISTSYARDLMFHRDAFTIAMRPLPVLASTEGYTYSAKGFSLRVMTGGDFTNDAENTRVDILATLAAVRPEWSCGMYR